MAPEQTEYQATDMTDITLQNFEADIIQESMRQPVLLDLWAPWCAPCRTLGPILEKVEAAYGGRFKLAKLNSDDQPEIASQLSQAFGVRSIPFCVLFHQGQPVDGFVGALPEAQVREFLDKHVPSEQLLEAEEQIEEAEALAAGGDPDAALARLEQALATDPSNDTARGEMVTLLLQQGRNADARNAYQPMATRAIGDQRITAIGHWLAAVEAAPTARSADELGAAIALNKRNFDARFALAQRQFAAGRFTDAMDELLEIVMRDKAWSDELARKTYVAILELMTKPAPKAAAAPAAAKGALEVTGPAASATTDPVVDSYRRKLSMALF